MSQPVVNNEAYTDVVELCALLQCLGFSVKSLDTSDGNLSQDGGVRSVVINCQEFGCSLLGSLPKSHRERLSKELHEMIRCIKQHNESDADLGKDAIANRSASMIELNTPEKREFPLKSDTPTRYRSLDTLTAAKRNNDQLPDPGPLHKVEHGDVSADGSKEKKQIMCRRQSTYTLSSTPGSVRRRNKTSSPIHTSQSTLLDNLIAAEKAAEDLHNKLVYVIREYVEDGKHDSSMSSLTLDVSKISLLKCPDASKAQFSSSPNLSAMGVAKEDFSRLKRFESVSTSNLAPKSTVAKESKITSRLRRISPNLFKTKKEAPGVKTDKGKTPDARSKLNSSKMKFTSLRRCIKNRNLGSPYILSDCDVVVDGDSFFKDTYSNSNSQYILGPDCDRYADFLINKLSIFLDSHVKCHFIFKGATKLNMDERQKLHENMIHDRIVTKINTAPYFQPLFAQDIQKQVLEEMDIKYFVCEYDSIEAIIGVARKLKCPVLTNKLEYSLFVLGPVSKQVDELKKVESILNSSKDCSQRQKRLYKQYMEQLAGAYVERCTDLSSHWDRRYSYRVPSPEWRYSLPCEDHWCATDGSRSCCGSECTDSGRCSSPCCSEVIFNGGHHFSGKRTPNMHVCHPICYPGNFG
ncbi:unnamed protein product [Spodoptera exigua]|nr:unnamed protein product [Spodoptera exigua]